MGAASDHLEDCGRAVKRSILLNHHFSCFDHGGDRVALLEFEFVGAAASDGALNEVVADPNHDMGHDIAELNFFDFSTQFVSG
jgi:hypothetical protein